MTWGLLYLLDPIKPMMIIQIISTPRNKYRFHGLLWTQTTVKAAKNVPCYVIFLDTDNYGLSRHGLVPNVELEFSDDQGQLQFLLDQLQINLIRRTWIIVGIDSAKCRPQ